MPDDTLNNGSDQILNDPSSFLFASLADFYRDHGLYEEAIAMCQSGLEAQPDNLDGRLVLARCLLATGDRASARDEAAKVLGRQPGHSEAKRLLAEIEKAKPSAPPSAPPAATPAAMSTAPITIKPVPETSAVPAAPSPQAGQSLALFPVAAPAAPAFTAAQQTARPMDTVLPAPPAAAEKPKQPPLPEPKPAAPVPDATVDPQTVYNRVLADLQQTPQVLACLLVDESGFVVAETYAGAVAGAGDSEASAALSISIFKTAAESMRKIKLGALERVIVETAAEKVFLRKAGSLLLLLSAEKSVKMGLVAVNSKRAVERISSLPKSA